MIRALILLSLLLPGAARADDDAELKRLKTELQTLARKGAWSGADRTYRSLVARQVPLDNPDHLVGYEAARQLGEPTQALRRVQRVRPPASDDADPSWETSREILESLALNYGLVVVVVGDGRDASLKRPHMPFAPDLRSAVERAAQVLEERRELRGLLPVGTYEIDGTSFTVEAGADWQTVILEPRQAS